VRNSVVILLLVAGVACGYPKAHDGKTRQQWVALLKSPDAETEADAELSH
jgi:hypothetical protein